MSGFHKKIIDLISQFLPHCQLALPHFKKTVFNVVYIKSLYSFGEPYETHKYTLWLKHEFYFNFTASGNSSNRCA